MKFPRPHDRPEEEAMAERRWRLVVCLVVLGMLAFGGRWAEASHLKESPKKHKIVYHLNEPSVEKAKFVLGNIENHVRGVGGWGNIEALELVVHGPALKNFLTKNMDPALQRALDALQTRAWGSAHAGTRCRPSTSPWTSFPMAPGSSLRGASCG